MEKTYSKKDMLKLNAMIKTVRDIHVSLENKRGNIPLEEYCDNYAYGEYRAVQALLREIKHFSKLMHVEVDIDKYYINI